MTIGALLVYRTTLLPGVGAWDTAEAQVALTVGGTMHPTGFPAYVVVGWLGSQVLGPLGSPAFAVNLLSAILVSAAAGGLVLVLRLLAVPLPVALAASAGFALAPATWSVASAADAHALHAALLVALLLALLRWAAIVRAPEANPSSTAAAPGRPLPAAPSGGRWRPGTADRALILAGAVLGVALANHGLTLLLLPAIATYVVAVEPGLVRRPRALALAAGAAAGVAALLYLELPLRAGPFRAPLVYGRPETWEGFWDVVLARQFQGSVGTLLVDPAAALGSAASTFASQLGGLVVLVPLALLVTALRSPRYALLSGTAALLTVAFAAGYPNAAIERYHLGPLLFAWSWLAVAADALAEELSASGLVRPRPALALLLAAALVTPTLLDLGPRWRTADRSRETWAGEWLDTVLGSLPPDAVVLSWWSYSTTLWYGQLVEGRRPDILVIDDRTRLDEGLGEVGDVIRANLGSRPVFVTRAYPAEVAALARDFALEPADSWAVLYRVTHPQESHR